MKLLSNNAASTLLVSVMVGFALLPLWLAQQQAQLLLDKHSAATQGDIQVPAPTVERQVVDLNTLSSGYPHQPWVPKPLPDFRRYKVVAQKKQAFFSYLYPVIREENRALLEIRWRLLRDIDWTLSEHADWLRALGESYRVKADSTVNEIRLALLDRVDIVPPSLAMAQAARDSLWGTTRYARSGNNLYNSLCYLRGCGFVPKNRSTKATHEVQKYSDVGGSVADYMYLINSSPKHREFRRIRRVAREEARRVFGNELAEGLAAYAPRNKKYVAQLQAALRFNKLIAYDRDMLNELSQLVRASDY